MPDEGATAPDERIEGMNTREAAAEAIAIHRAAGRRFEAGGVTSFVRDQGSGAPVVLMHGVPVSSFVYRRVVPLLAQQGLRGIAFDLPGLGLADRPADFDYSWSGLAHWTGEAIDALELGRCHLVVHDFGGPIGFEWAIRNPDRVLSLTVLDTLVGVASFRPVWTLAPMRVRGIGPLWLRSLSRPLFTWLYYLQGIADRAAVPRHEVHAHYELLRRGDRGVSLMRMMRGMELTEAKQRFLWEGLAEHPYPARIVWGERDPALGLDQMRMAQEVLRVEDPVVLPAKHFLQEDHAADVAHLIGDLAAPLG
jgi:haloalkane dehalogenase